MSMIKHTEKFPRIVFPIQIKDRKELGSKKKSKNGLSADQAHLQKRNKDANAYVGAFVGQLLAIEKNMDLALIKADSRISKKILGVKVAVLKDYLDYLDVYFDAKISGSFDVRPMLPALNEIRKVRNKFSTDFKYVYCPSSDLTMTIKFISSLTDKRFMRKISKERKDHRKSLVAITIFSQVLFEKLSYLAHAQK